MAKQSGKDGKAYYGASNNITEASHAGGTVTVTSASHGFSAGERVLIASVVGMTDLNAAFTIDAVTTNTFDVTLSTAQTYTSGGTARRIVQITDWTMNENAGTLDVSDSGDDGVSQFIPDEFTGFDGTFEGFTIGGVTPPAKGESVALQLDKDGSEYFSGSVILTQQTSNVQIKGGDAVKAAYTFQGTGTLTEA